MPGRDDPDAEILREVDHVFGTAIERDPACARSIGGTIIVAVIDADGFRWLRKPVVSEALNEITRTQPGQ